MKRDVGSFHLSASCSIKISHLVECEARLRTKSDKVLLHISLLFRVSVNSKRALSVEKSIIGLIETWVIKLPWRRFASSSSVLHLTDLAEMGPSSELQEKNVPPVQTQPLCAYQKWNWTIHLKGNSRRLNRKVFRRVSMGTWAARFPRLADASGLIKRGVQHEIHFVPLCEERCEYLKGHYHCQDVSTTTQRSQRCLNLLNHNKFPHPIHV